ncbi:MAG: hypothetical protein ACTHXA_13580 [Gulosibacter sp.]|uniref:hypothetical protein n=1 Tax=Gulosibacter sp. TaxID=2817531 RepID=UPI003F9397BD
MSEHAKVAPQWPILVLTALIGLESIMMIGVAGFLIYELITQPALSVATSIALVILAAIGAAFLAAVTLGILRGQTWARSAGIVWQVLQTAVAVVILQGDIAQVLGWALALVSLVVLVLLFHPTATEHLRRR